MKKLAYAFLIATLIFVCGACGAQKDTDVDTNVVADDEKAITITLFQVPPTLDTTSVNEFNATRLNYAIYDFLVDKDVDGNWIPSIAKSWEQVDELTWTFEIDDRFIFHNGELLTMDDVIYSFEHLRTGAATVSYASGVESATYDGWTLTFKLMEPDNSIIPQVVNALFIVNKEYCEATGDDAWNIAPIGTGPYKVVQYEPSVQAILHTWEGYPFNEPDIKQITVRGGADANARYVMLETEQAQFGGVLDYLNGQRAEKDGRFGVTSIADVGVAAMKFNVTKAPFDDVRVRQALAYALDRDTYCAVAEGSTPAWSMVAANFDVSTKASTMPEYDLTKAQALLEEAGYSTSKPLEFTVTTFMNEIALATYQSTLANIGIKMNIENVQTGAYVNAESSGNFEALYSRFVTRSLSPFEEVQYYASWGNKNTTGYKNDKVDELCKVIISSTDDNEISEKFAELQEIAGADIQMLPIMTPTSYWANQKSIKNVEFIPNGLFYLEKFTLEN